MLEASREPLSSGTLLSVSVSVSRSLAGESIDSEPPEKRTATRSMRVRHADTEV